MSRYSETDSELIYRIIRHGTGRLLPFRSLSVDPEPNEADWFRLGQLADRLKEEEHRPKPHRTRILRRDE